MSMCFHHTPFGAKIVEKLRELFCRTPNVMAMKVILCVDLEKMKQRDVKEAFRELTADI